MSTHIKRILVDIIDINNNPLDNVFIHYDESNITELYALIIGNNDTPYEGGYYYFKINFDETYPTKPPQCKFETINNKIRFNPNLYENGKICLSILGTWSGPSWKPVMNLKSILLNLQSLFSENPIVNEPMYNNLCVKNIKSLNYNKVLTYHNLNFGILEMYNNNNYYSFFNDIVKDHFFKNLNKNIAKLEELTKQYNNEEIKIFPWRTTGCKLEYNALLEDYKKLKM